ncbi:MAG: hypothetical protein AB1597_00300 [Chloroflexota bacterium]
MGCEKLGKDKRTCKVTKGKCYRGRKGQCEYYRSYWRPLFKKIDGRLPKSCREIMTELRKNFRENWRKHAENSGRKVGGRNVLSSPFEKSISNYVRRVLGYPDNAKLKGEIYGNNWDIVVEKNGSPACLISLKTYIGYEQIRETFASAYVAKRKNKNIEVYMVAIRPTGRNKDMDENAKKMKDYLRSYNRYIDDVFYLTAKPYFSDLTKKLKGK